MRQLLTKGLELLGRLQNKVQYAAAIYIDPPPLDLPLRYLDPKPTPLKKLDDFEHRFIQDLVERTHGRTTSPPLNFRMRLVVAAMIQISKQPNSYTPCAKFADSTLQKLLAQVALQFSVSYPNEEIFWNDNIDVDLVKRFVLLVMKEVVHGNTWQTSRRKTMLGMFEIPDWMVQESFTRFFGNYQQTVTDARAKPKRPQLYVVK
ncbi:MAG: hypothetical protein JWO43_598 [Candidatus Adlerbacteria bacterium]|nr:hypothetical protein [Candidatus Adlerbacteria bacterium]